MAAGHDHDRERHLRIGIIALITSDGHLRFPRCGASISLWSRVRQGAVISPVRGRDFLTSAVRRASGLRQVEHGALRVFSGRMQYAHA
jgi:hypothetical protein